MFYIFQNVFEADTYIIYSKIHLVNVFCNLDLLPLSLATQEIIKFRLQVFVVVVVILFLTNQYKN